MKINRIISFLFLIITIIMFISVTYAASIPSADASADKIASYIHSNDISTISIPTLLSWHKKVTNDTIINSKIDSALRDKTPGEIRSYASARDKNYLKSNVPSSILKDWEDKVDLPAIKDARSEADKEHQQAATDTQMSSKTINPSSFDPSDTQGSISSEKANRLGNKIVGAIQAVGSIASVAFLALIGIKYMLGSAEEKADYKSSMLPYIVGSILTFGACHIVAAIYNIMT